MSDPRGLGPVSVELNPTLAELLARICAAQDTEDYLAVLSKALGLYDLALLVMDCLGLAAFTVTGALTAFYQYPDSYRFLLPTMLGLITAVGGGMLRDMMARRMPVVLYMDVYAIASIVGGLVLCCLRHFTALELSVSSWIAFACVTLLRFCAIHFHWQLYHPHRKRRRQ